jgi:LPS-assembly protein
MVNNKWNLGADWRQDIDTHSPISGNFEVTFENDCAKMNFSLDLQYDEQDRLDRTFGLQVFLSGLGSNSNKKKFNNRCGG